MANSWLRLWHDMPNDPKWRTIARVSKQPISSVLAVYVHLLVIASNATERGKTQNVCSEDLASALDIDTEQIELILSAMQGRVLDGDMVSGWAKRQVEREDGSAERAKRWREAQKEAKQTHPNATERKQTTDTDTDTDTDTEKKEEAKASLSPAKLPDCPHETLIDLFEKHLPTLAQPKKSLWRAGKNAPALKARWRWVLTAMHEKGERKGLRLATTKDEAIAWFERYFAYVAESEFLTGSSSDWAADLGWLVNAGNFEKVLSGNYQNKLKVVA